MMNKPVRLASMACGADFEIDLTAFPDTEPVFAYVNDGDNRVEPLSGLEPAGTLTIVGQPDYMWLEGPRRCVLFQAQKDLRQGTTVSLRSLAVGEFCVEIYSVRPDQSVELLYREDFCFK